MEGIGRVHNVITEESITVYWNKSEDFSQGDFYQIFMDQMLVGTTDKTHYEIDDLDQNTLYSIQIRWSKSEKVITSATMTLRTKRKKKRIDITKEPYYAIGDNRTMNTEAIQRAIDCCTEESAVYIPRGIFLTGALRLHSDMELVLAEGAVLQGTDRPKDYLPKIKSRFEGTELMCYSSLLNLGEMDHNASYNCYNVVIRGKGTIASGGKALAENVIRLETENMKGYLQSLGEHIKECEKPETIPGRVRPRLINISNCRNVSISGLTLKNGASWNVHMIYSDQIVTEGCKFYSQDVWNGDGWDPDSSSNCTIFNCTFHTGDDAIAVKSGKNPEGNAIGRPCENIRIFDCTSSFGHGITIGSEMSGGVDGVHIWDCDMGGTRYGIEIKGTKKRGGYVRNVIVQDCVTSRVMFHAVSYNDDGAGALVPPVFEQCRFSRVQIIGEYPSEDGPVSCDAIELCGFDRPGYELKNIEFCDIKLGQPGQGGKHRISLGLCKNISFRNISDV